MSFPAMCAASAEVSLREGDHGDAGFAPDDEPHEYDAQRWCDWHRRTDVEYHAFARALEPFDNREVIRLPDEGEARGERVHTSE